MKIIHLSDLHFGTEENFIVVALKKAIEKAQPDLVIISGDFTQVGSAAEFELAQNFIQSLSAPVFCVPGNHDITRYSLWERFFNPYKKFKKYVEQSLFPVFKSKDVVIAGINSARRILPHWNWANGAISGGQLRHLETTFKIYDKNKTKRRVCVFHHPVHKALEAPLDTVVFGARNALEALSALEVDLVLTGHVHHASVTTLGDINHKTIYLSASTALSTRLRDQQNGFNLVELGDKTMDIKIYSFENGSFKCVEKYSQQLP